MPAESVCGNYLHITPLIRPALASQIYNSSPRNTLKILKKKIYFKIFQLFLNFRCDYVLL